MHREESAAGINRHGGRRITKKADVTGTYTCQVRESHAECLRGIREDAPIECRRHGLEVHPESLLEVLGDCCDLYLDLVPLWIAFSQAAVLERGTIDEKQVALGDAVCDLRCKRTGPHGQAVCGLKHRRRRPAIGTVPFCASVNSSHSSSTSSGGPGWNG